MIWGVKSWVKQELAKEQLHCWSGWPSGLTDSPLHSIHPSLADILCFHFLWTAFAAWFVVLKTDREIKRTRHLSVRLIEFPCRDYLPIIISCREEIRYFRLRGTLSTKLLSIKHSRILFLKISWRVNCVWCKDCVVCFFKVMLVCVWLG